MQLPESRHLKLQLLLAAIIFCGSMTSIILGRDIFPFSNYPMYSKPLIPNPYLRFFTVVGVDANDDLILLRVPRYLKPFWGSSFREALLVENDPAKTKLKLDAAARWYKASVMKNPNEERRRKDSIEKLRLYRHHVPWEETKSLEEDGRNFNDLLIEHAELLIESEAP